MKMTIEKIDEKHENCTKHVRLTRFSQYKKPSRQRWFSRFLCLEKIFWKSLKLRIHTRAESQ